MADYAGARAAMRARFVAGWTDRTPISFQNERPPEPWPPVIADPQPDDPDATKLRPYVYFEILSSGSELATHGTPGHRLWTYEGEINVHVFVPVGDTDADATTLAIAAGEIFRAASFYDGPDGQRVRTLTPSIDDGDSGDDDGVWFRVSMSVDFTYWHRG